MFSVYVYDVVPIMESHETATWVITEKVIGGDSTIKSSCLMQKDESENGGNKKTKHVKVSKKTNISYPLIRTRTYRLAARGF